MRWWVKIWNFNIFNYQGNPIWEVERVWKKVKEDERERKKWEREERERWLEEERKNNEEKEKKSKGGEGKKRKRKYWEKRKRGKRKYAQGRSASTTPSISPILVESKMVKKVFHSLNSFPFINSSLFIPNFSLENIPIKIKVPTFETTVTFVGT